MQALCFRGLQPDPAGSSAVKEQFRCFSSSGGEAEFWQAQLLVKGYHCLYRTQPRRSEGARISRHRKSVAEIIEEARIWVG